MLIGAEDDVLWDAAKYIRRMEEREHICKLEAVVYKYGTHFVFPESMLKMMLPIGSASFVKFCVSICKKTSKGMP